MKKYRRRSWNSIVQDDPSKCYECECRKELVTHHIFGGRANRWKSDDDGLYVRLCVSDHQHVHKYPKGVMNIELRQEAQRKWMQYYGKTEDEFRERYGRSVIE